MARRILIIGDDSDATKSLRKCLDILGCSVDTATDESEVMTRIGAQGYSGVVLDTTASAIKGTRILALLMKQSMVPVIVLSDNSSENDVMQAGAQAFLEKPFPILEFKRAVQRVIPPTREELTQDHSGGEATIYRNVLALAKAGDFVAARRSIELLDDTRMADICLLAYQVKAGDLAGATDTALSLQSLKVGGHWVRCMITPLVKSGDVQGALAIVENLTDAEDRNFHRGVIVAQLAATGDLSGAQTTLLSLLPGESGYEHAVGAIAYALVERGDFVAAAGLASQLSEEFRMNAICEILSAQVQRDGVADAMRTAADITDEGGRQQAYLIIESIRGKSYQPVCTLLLLAKQWINGAFSELYPVD